MNMLKARDEYRKLWPQLRSFFPWDKQYDPFRPEELIRFAEIVKQARIIYPDGIEVVFGDLTNLGDFWDCDDFACGGEFLTKLRHKCEVEEKMLPRIPKSYGQARGYMFILEHGLHALNTAITTEGIYFQDFDRGGKTWPANKATE